MITSLISGWIFREWSGTGWSVHYRTNAAIISRGISDVAEDGSSPRASSNQCHLHRPVGSKTGPSHRLPRLLSGCRSHNQTKILTENLFKQVGGGLTRHLAGWRLAKAVTAQLHTLNATGVKAGIRQASLIHCTTQLPLL